jgi:hypothetical protein
MPAHHFFMGLLAGSSLIAVFVLWTVFGGPPPVHALNAPRRTTNTFADTPAMVGYFGQNSQGPFLPQSEWEQSLCKSINNHYSLV